MSQGAFVACAASAGSAGRERPTATGVTAAAGDVVRRNSGTPNATSLSRSARAVSNSHSDAQ